MGVFGAAALGVVGTVGSSLLSKGGQQSSTQTSDNSPWAPQAAALQVGYDQASTNMKDQLAAGPYTGNYVAGPNQTQTNAQNQAATYAENAGNYLSATGAGVSMALQPYAGAYGANAANMATGNATTPNAGVMNNLNSYASGNGMAGVHNVNAGLSSALNSAATQGANALGTYNSGLTGVMNSAQQNSTQGIINDANQYVNSSATQSAIDNANRQINQTLTEQTNPSFNRAASAGGNMNSSRAGMGEAMNNENAAIAMGNATSQITNNAYNTGVATAANQHTAGLNTALSAAQGGLAANTALAQGNQNTQLAQQLGEANSQNAAAQTALGQQTSADALNANSHLAGNAQLGNAVNTGLNAALNSSQLANSNYALGASAGDAQQAGVQAGLTNAYDQWSGKNNYNTGVLNNYMGVVSQGSGGSSTSTGTQTPASNLASNVLGGGLAGAGLYNLAYPTQTGTQQGLASAAQQYQNPYGVTGSGNQVVGLSGLMGGGV